MAGFSSIENKNARLTPYEYNMLMESFDYIRNHDEMTNLDIPDHFLRFWAIPNFGINPHYQVHDAQMLVFMYILKLYYHSPEQIEKLLSSYLFTHLYYTFQLILTATLHARFQNLSIRSFPILNLEAYPISMLNEHNELFRQFERITNQKIIFK